MLKLSSWSGWLGLAVAVTALTTTACTQKPNTTAAQSSTQLQPLTSVTSDWIGFSSYYVAAQKGLFASTVSAAKDAAPLNTTEAFVAFMTGKVDIAWVTTGDAAQMIERDPSIKIIYVTDYSNGSDGIVGRNIKVPQDLKGKTIARENLLYEKVFLRAYLNKAGLTEKDVKIQDMVAADAAKAFVDKKVDVAVTYEPFVTKSAKAGGGNVLFSTKDTNLVADVIVVRQQLIKTRKSEIQAYLKAVDKAVKLVKAEDPEALKIIAAQTKVTTDEVKSQLKGARLFDLEENKKIAFNKNDPNSVFGNLKLIAKGVTDFHSELIDINSQPIDPNSMYDTSLIK